MFGWFHECSGRIADTLRVCWGCILSVFIHDLIICVMNAGVWSCTDMNESCRCGACSDVTGLQASVPKMHACYTLRLTLREAGGR